MSFSQNEWREAKAIALEEAAEHLGLHWTDDALEFSAGEFLGKRFLKEAGKLREKIAATQ